jgi:ATP-dependent DNA helicase RecG
MTEEELILLLGSLIKQNKESECVEYKLNYHSAEEIGERISALSNSACLNNEPFGYLVFGIKSDNRSIEGTTFTPNNFKHKNEDIEHWLAQRLSPRIDFKIYEFDYNSIHIALFQIPATYNQPVEFMHESYVRVATITRKLRDFPDKARKIWKKESEKPFEMEISIDKCNASDIIRMIDIQC